MTNNNKYRYSRRTTVTYEPIYTAEDYKKDHPDKFNRFGEDFANRQISPRRKGNRPEVRRYG